MAKSKTQNPNHTTLEGETLLDDYVLAHSDNEPEYLYKLWRATNIHMLHGRMASGRLQGRLLKMLIQMVKPDNIIEVGTFSGYSALCMAEGLQSNGKGHLYTFEINDEQEPFTRQWIEQSPWAEHITFIIGDAAEEAQKLGIQFDFAFLDGDKRTYVETYEALLPLMSHGAFILADNTLWDGHVIDPEYDRDHQTQGIRRFNDHIMADDRVTRVILPLRDGLTIIRKL
ncbi:MAG: O-methyltransferase [Prevotella sp.]|nr:O-methyltransferase [Prevotella sp.]